MILRLTDVRGAWGEQGALPAVSGRHLYERPHVF